jgi:hypothetical protein
MAVQRFRKTFPRARRDDLRNVWYVPGTASSRRIGQWLELEARAPFMSTLRDLIVFEPIVGKYLEQGDDLVVRTPGSRTVVALVLITSCHVSE